MRGASLRSALALRVGHDPFPLAEISYQWRVWCWHKTLLSSPCKEAVAYLGDKSQTALLSQLMKTYHHFHSALDLTMESTGISTDSTLMLSTSCLSNLGLSYVIVFFVAFKNAFCFSFHVIYGTSYPSSALQIHSTLHFLWNSSNTLVFWLGLCFVFSFVVSVCVWFWLVGLVFTRPRRRAVQLLLWSLCWWTQMY